MGGFKKIVLLLAVLAVVYFGALELGFLGGLEKLKAVDARYGLGGDKLVPGTIEELSSYEEELGGIDSEEASGVIAVKLELVEMQKALLEYGENVSAIDFDAPDCGVSGSVESSKRAGERAIGHAQNALMKKSALKGTESGFGYILKSDFDSTLGAAIDAVSGQVNTLKTIC